MANVIVNKLMSASVSVSVSMGVSSEFMVIHTEEVEEAENEEWSPQVVSQLVMIAKLSVSLWVESAARSAIFG